MKKFIASIAALSMCALMLTACGDKTDTGDAGITESITAEQTEAANNTADDDSSAKGETEADKSDDSADDKAADDGAEDSAPAETEAESNDAGSSEAAASYASIDEFINDDGIFDLPGEPVDAENSYTYAFAKSFEGGSGFYIDLESTDGTMKINMGMEADRLAMNATMPDDKGVVGNVSLIITDGKVYMLDPAQKSGFFMALSDEQISQMFDQYDPEEILANVNIDTDTDFEGVLSSKVEIAGEIYTFEYMDKAGMLYDKSGKICTVVSGDSSTEIPAIIINEFSTNVPAGAFDVPSDYELMDLGALTE